MHLFAFNSILVWNVNFNFKIHLRILCILTLKLTFQTNILLNVRCMCWCLSIIQSLHVSAHGNDRLQLRQYKNKYKVIHN